MDKSSDSLKDGLLNGGFGPHCPSSTPPTINLMRLYKEIIRSELCKHTIESIYKLCDHHLSCSNYVEAGFTLKLHADKLNWSWDIVPPDTFGSLTSGNKSFNDTTTNNGNNNGNGLVNSNNGSQQQQHRGQQFEWQLKENLYMTIIDYFDRGKCWEEGIPLMKELSEFYEKKSFDYFKWSHLLKNQSLFLDNILTQFRPESEYFRVGFYGSGFPAFLRNKVFIYRGLEFEKIAAFTERLQNEFPMATLITKSGPVDDTIHEKDGQFMQVVSVKPVQDSRPDFDGKDVPDKVLTYYLTNNVRTFISDRPLHKGQVDRENEFKSLWIERSTLTIADKLPGILRWSEVTSKKITELSPIEHACETVENMNRELQKLIVSYSMDPSMAISPLSMRLQGVIEAAVNGGVAKYQDAFFNPKYIHLHPEQGPYIRRLKQLILQKVRILEGGLSLHGRLAPTSIQPLQRRLLERLTLMRQNVQEASANVMDSSLDCFPSGHRRNPSSIIHQPLPPIPVLEPVVGDHSSLPTILSSGDNSRRTSCDVYQAPSLTSNGNVSHLIANNNNYHDVIYAVPSERYTDISGDRVDGINDYLASQLDGLVLVDNSGNIIDPSSPPPLPPKRPKRPRSTNNSSLDMTSPETPPPRPPIPTSITSPIVTSCFNDSNISNNSNMSSQSMDRSLSFQRSRSIPRSNNSFQLSNIISMPTQVQSPSIHEGGTNGNLYTPSPTRSATMTTTASLDASMMSPEVPPRAISHNHHHPLSMDSMASRPRAMAPAPTQPTQPKDIVSNTRPKVDTDEEVKPVLPPKTVRKTISSNQLDSPAVTSDTLSRSSLSSSMVGSNVTSISVNGGRSTSTLPNRRPPPPTPPLSSSSSGCSPPPPHHPPPPAPPLSSAEESELLSMSLASSSILDDTNSFSTISNNDTNLSTSNIMTTSPAAPSKSSGPSSAVSVITVNNSQTTPTINDVNHQPTTIIRVSGTIVQPQVPIVGNTPSAVVGERISCQSIGSNSSSSSNSSTNCQPLDDIKGV